MGQQSLRQAARKAALDVRAARRVARAQRERRLDTVHPVHDPSLIIAPKNALLGQGVCQNSRLSSSTGRLLRKRCMAALGIVR